MAKSIYGACDGALSDSTTFIEPWGKDITTFKVEFGNYNRDYGEDITRYSEEGQAYVIKLKN